MRVEKGINSIELRRMSEVSGAHFVLKLLLCGGLMSLMGSLALRAAGFYWLVPSAFLGLMCCHAAELQHQCLHNTAFRNKRLNSIIGVLLGLPMLVSFSDYQYNHLRHHRLLGTPEDREFFNYGSRRLTLKTLIPQVFMFRHFEGIFRYVFKSVKGDLKPEMPRATAVSVRSEYRLLAFVLLGAAGLSIWLEPALFLKLWLFPLLCAAPVHYLIELPEHIGCDEQTAGVTKNTRTIKASRIAVWFVNGNNYHVEHHWLPSVPNHRFPELHDVIRPEIKHLETSYWSFYRRYFSTNFRRTSASVTLPDGA